MQKFTQGFLPASFNEVWVTNAIRRANQDHVELRNDDDINIPFARLSSTERQPLACFPRIWSQFPDEQIKFTRNVPTFNKLLKQHYLRKLSSTPRCTRLFCPHCMPWMMTAMIPTNLCILIIASLSSNLIFQSKNLFQQSLYICVFPCCVVYWAWLMHTSPFLIPSSIRP
jgi:hypothetical protein